MTPVCRNPSPAMKGWDENMVASGRLPFLPITTCPNPSPDKPTTWSVAIEGRQRSRTGEEGHILDRSIDDQGTIYDDERGTWHLMHVSV
jgi:hypothetical protein